jgi:peptide/nickel transport system permease protein
MSDQIIENKTREDLHEKVKKKSQFKAVMARLFKNKGATVGLIIISILILLAIFAPLVAPYGYTDMNMANRFSHETKENFFGTDELGRDIFSRILYGGRYSIQIGLLATLVSASAGMIIGSIVGFYGGKIDNIIMRITDIIQAIPGLLLSVIVAAVLGNGLYETVLALSIGGIPNYIRILRGSILTVRKNEYIDAAIADNSGSFRTIIKHILPNAISPIIVQATMGSANCILTAASLSFIGLGVQPPNPEWGAMLSAGRNYIRDHAHMVIYPGVAIMLTVLSLNLLGDGLRDALDPKLKR